MRATPVSVRKNMAFSHRRGNGSVGRTLGGCERYFVARCCSGVRMKTVSRALVAAFATSSIWLAPPSAFAQPGASVTTIVAAPRVDGFDVEQVPQLTPGTSLLFSLYGTPGASATLQIAGLPEPLAMQEVQS